MDRAYHTQRKHPRRPAKGGLVDGFADEHTIYGGYNQSPMTSTGETSPGIMRLLDNFTFYVQTDDEGSEELVDLQDFTTDGVNGLPLKVTGTVLDHRLCAQQSVYDARSSSRMKVRLHAVRDWVVDYSPYVAVWLVTDWAWYRLLSPSRIYKQIYDPIEAKTELAAACQTLLAAEPQLPYQAAVQRLAHGVAVPQQVIDPDADYAHDGHEPERHQFQENILLSHAAFVVQQLGPMFGRHAYKNFLATLAEKAGVPLSKFMGTGRSVAVSSSHTAAADMQQRPAPHKDFMVPMDTVPSLLLVWDFCQRYGQLLRLPPFPFARLQLACLNQPPVMKAEPGLATPSPSGGSPDPQHPSCKQCDAVFSSPKALRQHCTASGHDPSKAPRAAKQKSQPSSTGAGVPLELTVTPTPDEIEMDRWGPVGQGRLLCEMHAALVRVLEGLDEDLMEAPTMAGYGSATDLAPVDSYRPLLGAAWPELARRYLQEHAALSIGEDAVEAVLRLKGQEYNKLSVHDRALILEALVNIVANTEQLRKHLQHLDPEGGLMVNRGGALGQDAAGNIYHHLGGNSARGDLYVESSADLDWGWYSPQQIPDVIAWLEGGSQQEQQLAEDIYALYQPVLRIALQPSQEQVIDAEAQQQLWQPLEAGGQPPTITPDVLLQPKDGYKGSLPVINGKLPLQQELLRLLATAPFWNKDLDWLQSRAAVQALLPRAVTGPDFARLLWLIEELLYEDLLKGSGWGRRRGWFREQLEAVRNIAQAATLGGQLAAHCRREADLGVITPQELLQSAQRQRCYLGYIPQPPQDVVLFKSGFEAHVRQQDRSIPPIPAWIDSWAPMQDCKVKQMACVVEPMTAAAKQHALRAQAQAQPGVPPKPLDPPCSAWLLLERDMATSDQKLHDSANEEIDWTHFTFQHGFRILPQQSSFPGLPIAASHTLTDMAGAASGTPKDARMMDSPEAGMPEGPAEHAVRSNQLKSEDMSAQHAEHTTADAGADTHRETLHDHQATAAQQQRTGSPAHQQRDLATGAGAAQQAHNEGLSLSTHQNSQPGINLHEAQLHHEAEEAEEGMQEQDDVEGEGEVEVERASDDETTEAKRTTRSRRNNAAELYMLDHGSQLVPRKVRQAPQRPVQRPARLMNALDDAASVTPGDADRPTPVGPMLLLPAEDKVRFWLKERSLLAVALHVKPGMTRAAEFLVPIQLCNRALATPWPAGMAVKMPFTGTVLDHLTKPRPDTRFCTGLLQKALPALRPAALPVPPAITGASTTATSTQAQHQAPANAAAVTPEPKSPTAPVRQQVTGTAAATQPAAQASSTADAQAGAKQEPASVSQAPVLQAQPTQEAVQTQAHGAVQQSGSMLVPGNELTQAYEPVFQPDPWNALEIMWDSDTPPGWPKLICPWQVLEDRGGELRQAKERYRQAEAEKREKARQEALARDAARRAAQQAAAATQAERMRRALEARAVVAQVAEQKEAGRAALAAAQGPGQHVTGLAHAVPRPGAAAAMANLGLSTSSIPSANGDHAAYFQQLQQGQPVSSAAIMTPTGAGAAMQPQFMTQSLSQLPGQLQAAASHHIPQSSSVSGQLPPIQLHPQAGATASGPNQATGQLPGTVPYQAMAAFSGTQSEAQQHGLLGIGPPPHLSVGDQGAAVPSANQQASGAGQGVAGRSRPPASPPPQPAQPGQKRGRSAEAEGEQGSSPRAKKAKPTAEGYRERWVAHKPRAQAKTWCSMLCSACEQGADDSELLVCKGPCLRAYHPACLGLPQQTPTAPSSQAAWFCPECLHGRVRCFVCGEFGAGFDDPSMRKCSLGVCGRFYHIKCAQSLELTQMAKKGAHFRCPQHYCAVCRKSGDGVDMVKCIRCPTAYHSSCMPRDIQRLVPHAKVVLCAEHGKQGLDAYQAPPPPEPGQAGTAQAQASGMSMLPAKAEGSADNRAVAVMEQEQQEPQALGGLQATEHLAAHSKHPPLPPVPLSDSVGPMQRMLLQQDGDPGSPLTDPDFQTKTG